VRPVIAASEGGASIAESRLMEAYGKPAGSLRISGTSTAVCEAVEALLKETGADGISIDALWLPNYVAALAAYLITPLQRAGRIPIRYAGETLRENLRLPLPALVNPHLHKANKPETTARRT